ncbi:HlyD family type I secretion periplasmic adaptor subunit [Clostridium oceanicum]|uniref:HlyD family type I secretion periplasmic adaptor subunit n=1 Tax=Clostridium oceanicum TaxID=1543 RepID=A0ABP3UIS4_9CLOT
MKLFKRKNVRTEFLPSAIEIVETPASPLGKFSIWAIFLIVLAAFIWSFSKVNEVATARGKVIPSGNTNIVQSLTGGTIKSINVKEGEDVKKGEVLLTIDDGQFKTDKSKLENQLEVLKTSKDILQAYKEGKKPDIDVKKFKESKALILEKLGYSKTIESIYSIDLENTDMGINDSKEDISKTQKKLSEEEGKLSKLRIELQNLENNQKSNANEDANKGEDKKSEIERKKSEIKNSEDRIENIKESIKDKQDNLKIKENNKEKYKLNHKQELEKESVNVLNAIEEHKKAIEKVNKQMKELIIKSPVDGKIQKSAVNTVGGVLQAGAPIMHIVPKNKELIVEAMILNKDIGFVSKDQKVQLKFDTFDFQRYGTIEGTITKITPDAVEINNQSMYKASIKLSKKDININGKALKFSPGMTVTCDIDTGERRIIDFFIPGIKDVKNSFRLR